MTRTCCHEQLVDDQGIVDSGKWTVSTISGLINIASGALVTLSWVGTQCAPDFTRNLAIGELFSWEINISTLTTPGTAAITCGGIQLWNQALGAGMFTGTAYATSAANWNMICAVANSMNINHISVVKHGMGKGA